MDDVNSPQALRDLFERLPASELLRQLPQPLALIDTEGRVLAANPALLHRCALSQDALEEMTLAQLKQRLADAGEAGEPSEQAYPLRLDAGHVLLWSPGEGHGRYAAQRDELTGLLTQRAFEERLRMRLARQRDGVFIRFEIDQFKLIHDAYGRQASERLIAQFGQLIASLLREEDEPARLNGDGFAVSVEDTDAERAWQIAERVRLQVAAQGFEWNGHAYDVTVSAGVVAFADAFFDFTELMAASDAACETARARGRNRIEIYRRSDDELSRLRGAQSWGARVLDTLEANRFALYRQRIEPLASANGRPHYEALLRVRGASGWSTPAGFVAAAERYGLMPQVDRRVIARVLREMAGIPPAQRPVIAVNLSGHSLGDQGLASYIARQLEYHEVSPDLICFEITETAAIANTTRAVALVDALKALGCSVALDDFGAGMSSFSYLKTLAVDALKIDGSFVRNVAHDAVDAATVESMVKVARLRGLKTIAECVENAEALTRLGELGVHYAQGFHLHRPEPWSLP